MTFENLHYFNIWQIIGSGILIIYAYFYYAYDKLNGIFLFLPNDGPAQV